VPVQEELSLAVEPLDFQRLWNQAMDGVEAVVKEWQPALTLIPSQVLILP
jgi:hypothetical protein